MKYLYGFILLRSITSSTIKNNKINIPNKICRDCKYFIANEKKCMYFNEIDLVTGRKTFNYASTMRDTECGQDAKYFEENKIKYLTVPYYFLKDYWTIIPTVFITVAYCIVILIKK